MARESEKTSLCPNCENSKIKGLKDKKNRGESYDGLRSFSLLIS